MCKRNELEIVMTDSTCLTSLLLPKQHCVRPVGIFLFVPALSEMYHLGNNCWFKKKKRKRKNPQTTEVIYILQVFLYTKVSK